MAHSSTLRSVLGFVKAVAQRRLPFLNTADHIDGIYNYVAIDGLFPTSGQPSESQLALIAEAGYETVINLAPSSVFENAVLDEADILRGLGVRYVHIPVNFNNPTDEDFASFRQAVERADPSKLWVHCAANMRVSAFVYRYRREVLGAARPAARRDLEKLWEPYGVWKRFVDRSDSEKG